MKQQSDIISKASKQCSNKPHSFKKKGGGGRKGKRQQSTADNFQGCRFLCGNLRTIERLGLYISTQFKNRSDMKKCLMQEKIVKPEVPELAENHTAHKKHVWEYHLGELMKTERVLEGNLCNLFAVLKSLCDYDTKNQVEASMEYSTLEMSLD